MKVKFNNHLEFLNKVGELLKSNNLHFLQYTDLSDDIQESITIYLRDDKNDTICKYLIYHTWLEEKENFQEVGYYATCKSNEVLNTIEKMLEGTL